MSTKFPISVTALNEREALIANEKSTSKRTHRFYEYRNSTVELSVIRLPIGIPLYRIANYRTNLLQLRWLRENKRADDFFSSGEENESVQLIQHSFLWTLAKTEKESIASIIDRLKKDGQREPLLITSSGVVVNGNRRLSSMRELLRDEHGQFEDFAYIDCMVLPPEATEDDLKEIEVRLQMTPETRLPYDWIGECIAIKDLRHRNKSFETISNWMRLDTSKVKDKLLILNEIDLYLKDWKNAEADYDQLSDAEEIFTHITKRIKSKEGIQQELARKMGWILLDQRGKDGRVYDLRDVTGNLLQDATSKIQEVFASDIESNGIDTYEEGFELEFEDTDSSNSELSIVNFLDKSRNNDQLQQEIVNILKGVVEAKKMKVSGDMAKKKVLLAHTTLLEVDLTSADSTTYPLIHKQLKAIESRVGMLKAQLDKLLDLEE